MLNVGEVNAAFTTIGKRQQQVVFIYIAITLGANPAAKRITAQQPADPAHVPSDLREQV